MKILSIDPGYGRCGWAILEKPGKLKISSCNQETQLVACDCIETEAKKSLPDRLKEIYDAVIYIIKKYHPDELAIESLFWFKNQKTALAVAQARGVLILAAKNYCLSVCEYTPLQVKSAVVGYGKATKEQISKIIKLHLRGQAVPIQDDTADAVAIGLTHLQTSKFK